MGPLRTDWTSETQRRERAGILDGRKGMPRCPGMAAAARVALGVEEARGLLRRMRGPGSLMHVKMRGGH